MHHATKRAAVKAYQPLFAEGKTESEVKEAIAADPKSFTPEEVDEIYNEIGTPEEGEDQAAKDQAAKDQAAKDLAAANKSEAKKSFVAIDHFRDRHDFKTAYNAGDDVSHFDADRLAHLINTGLVKEL